MIIETQAYARAGLLGNPSDGYFGKTISIIVKNFSASVSLYEAPELRIEPMDEDLSVYRSIHELADSLEANGYYGGERLVKAAIRTFHRYARSNNLQLHNRNFAVRYRSSIPRQVGLAGSSAIVTATMRALIKFYQIDVPIEVLPSLILSAEKDELGINAGLQDRVIQTYEGCVYMNFAKEIMDAKGHGQYERLDTSLLPNLYIGYKTQLSKVSGVVLNDLATRYKNNDPLTLQTLARLAQVAEEGKTALLKRDYVTLNRLTNENFDLRRKIMNISDSNIEMVECARACGASAKFPGSGGSIIGIYPSDEVLNKLIVELKQIKVRVIKPYVN
jgi:glucuronokinase